MPLRAKGEGRLADSESEQDFESSGGAGSKPKTPKWVWAAVVIVIVVLMLFVASFVEGGKHGLDRHIGHKHSIFLNM